MTTRRSTARSPAAAQCGVDLVKLIGHKLNIDLSVAFPIGPIPGQLTIKIEPVLKLEGEAEAKVEVTFAPQFTVGAKAGVAYTEAAGWTHTFEVQKSGSLAPDFPDVGGEVSLAGKVTAGLKLATLLYDTAGPFIAVTHFGEGKLTAKVPECTWDATLDLGTDVTLGAELQVPVFDKTILELKKKFNLAKLRVKEAHGNLVQCADAGVEAGVDAGIEAGVDAGVDAAEDAAPADATPDVTPLDAGPSDATADQSDAGCPSPAWSHTTLPNADIDSNPNNVSVWTCGPNEFLSKLFIGEQATYHDEMGMICASSCDASQTREHVPVETFTSKTYYGCPAGERIIGVAYKDPVSPPPCNAPWAPDCPRDWLDVFAVFCVPESNLGATPTLQPNGAYTANANAPKVFLCTGGDEFIGFGVKSMPEWHSDYIDGITPVCRKQLP